MGMMDRGMTDRAPPGAEHQPDLGFSKLAQVRTLLAEAELRGRPDDDVLDDIAFVVGKPRRDADIYQKPLG